MRLGGLRRCVPFSFSPSSSYPVGFSPGPKEIEEIEIVTPAERRALLRLPPPRVPLTPLNLLPRRLRPLPPRRVRPASRRALVSGFEGAVDERGGYGRDC